MAKQFLAYLCSAALLLNADALPVSKPKDAGLDPSRLPHIEKTMRAHIDANHIPGAIGLIARNGKLGYFEAFGYADSESKKPMKKDSIFRIYSMTKAVTGVAVMMLYEEGKFMLTDPIGKYLPEFSSMKVAVDKTLVSAERPITIRDLLRHTSGMDYFGPKDENGKMVYQQLKLQEPGIDLAEMVRRLAKAPLLHHPGTAFHYGLSIDVLGRLVEVISGQPLDTFFEERIFKPLNMPDTAFYVPESKWDRLVTLYTPKGDGTVVKLNGDAQDSYKKKPSIFMGGAGLVSTAMDYARFCQMLLNGGHLDGKRLLSRKGVEIMSADHLGNLPRAPGLGSIPTSYGFGLTFAVNKGPGPTGAIGTEGEYFWSGIAGTRFWIDPKEKTISVFMVNVMNQADSGAGLQFKQLVGQALE